MVFVFSRDDALARAEQEISENRLLGFRSRTVLLDKRLPCSKNPLPERTLVASVVEATGKQYTYCSFHIPPGSNWDELKSQTLETIARWIASQPTPLVFGIDANAPKTDHPGIRRNEWWWEDSEPLLLGSNPLHKLRDAYRVFLEAHPDEMARVMQARPCGPLAVSHLRGKRTKTECRYDFVYVSSEIVVQRVAYLFEEAVRASSDHAVVIADLQVA
jgi:endonuclease/exonuclease/phosphatase family metal-dependent hydrolase